MTKQVLLVAGVVVALAGTARAQQPCEALASLRLPTVTITSATAVPPGPFAGPAGPAAPQRTLVVPGRCEVRGVIRPTTDSEIKFALWMPASGWNGKYRQEGNGGWAGTINARRPDRAAEPWLRGRRDRQRTRRRWRLVGDRPPREADRFRTPCRARNQRAGEGDRSRLLRPRARAQLFQRLFGRRARSADGGTAVSGRLQRHHRGCTSQRLVASVHRVRLERAGAAGNTRQQHPARQAASDSAGRRRVVRCHRWTCGWPD